MVAQKERKIFYDDILRFYLLLFLFLLKKHSHGHVLFLSLKSRRCFYNECVSPVCRTQWILIIYVHAKSFAELLIFDEKKSGLNFVLL